MEDGQLPNVDWLLARNRTLRCLVAFDPLFPGRGFDAHSPEQITDHAMAYGLYLSAVSLMKMGAEAQNASCWLVENVTESETGPGWGLGFEWAAFGKTQPNTVDTVYGITTALVVQGLLDASQHLGMTDCLQLAASALEAYIPYSSPTASGRYFWYSNSPDDAKNVHNVNAMMAGQYHRAGILLDRSDFLMVAREAADDVVAHMQTGPNGFFWFYSDTILRPNDAVHAAYTVAGLAAVVGNMGPSSKYYPAIQYLRKFFRDNGVYEFVRHETVTKRQLFTPARPWGIGALLYVGCELSDDHLIKRASHFTELADPFYPRQASHIALGLARLSDYHSRQN